jgi:hypothetical protein
MMNDQIGDFENSPFFPGEENWAGFRDRAKASPFLCEEHRRVGRSSPNIGKDLPYAAILQSRTHARLAPSNGFCYHTILSLNTALWIELHRRFKVSFIALL